MSANKPKGSDAVGDSVEIQIESVVMMKDMLRAHTTEWAKDMVELMYPQTDAQKKKNPVNDRDYRRVYNVVSGQIKNNRDRVLFITKGRELLDRYRTNHNNAVQIVNELQLSTQS